MSMYKKIDTSTLSNSFFLNIKALQINKYGNSNILNFLGVYIYQQIYVS